MSKNKETTLSEMVNKLLALQKVLPGDTPMVADCDDDADSLAPLHFDAVVDVFPTHITKNDDPQSSGNYKEVIVMATGSTAGGDIIPAVRLRLNKKRAE